LSEHVCILCRVYRPDGQPRHAADVCPADRARLERDLLAIPGLFRRVVDGEDPVSDHRWHEVVDADGQPTGQLRRRDPVAGLLPVGAVAARVHQASVTGSRDAPLPIDVDAVDLTAPARSVGAATGDARDQIGYLPVATVLDSWARHFRDCLRPGFRLPRPDVDSLVAFLDRHLLDAVEALPAVLPSFAGDLRALGSALRHILQENEPVPQPLLGVRCRRCRTMSTLVPWPTGEYVECRACGQLYNPADRVALAKEQAADAVRPRTVDGLLPEFGCLLAGLAPIGAVVRKVRGQGSES
jgi:hypothetical protein